MLLDYYKLSEEPFGVTPDPRFLYLSQQHREAMASLAYGTETGRGFLALIAEPGMGKTSLLYQYLESLRGKARTAFLFRTDCDSREFMRHLLLDLGIESWGRDLPWMHEALNRLLLEELNAGRRFVLVIDEAQNLEESVLESVRLLSNFETPWAKLIQIVIAGQPQLAEILKRPSAAQVRQRISLVIRIAPLSPADVDQYISHRLRTADCKDPSIFSPGARQLIAEHSGGIPRNINNLCFNAMSLACALKHRVIDRDVVWEVITDLDLESLAKGPRMLPLPPNHGLSAPPQPREPQAASLPMALTRPLAVAALVLAITSGVDHDSVRKANPGGISTDRASQPSTPGTPEAAEMQDHSTQASPLSSGLAPVQIPDAARVENPGRPPALTPEAPRVAAFKKPERVDPGQQILVPPAQATSAPAEQRTLQTSDSSGVKVGKE